MTEETDEPDSTDQTEPPRCPICHNRLIPWTSPGGWKGAICPVGQHLLSELEALDARKKDPK